MNTKKILTIAVSLVFLALTGLLFNSLTAQAADENSGSAKELKLNEQEVREQMIKISAELGVACTECHNVNNFRDDSLINFRVAKEHLKLVQMLKAGGMNGQRNQPEATCYTCHRGELKYDHKMKANSIFHTATKTEHEAPAASDEKAEKHEQH